MKNIIKGIVVAIGVIILSQFIHGVAAILIGLCFIVFSGFFDSSKEDTREDEIKRIQKDQENARTTLLKQGIDISTIVPIIGKDSIKWTDIVRQVFRVIEFDRAGTIVLANGTIKALSNLDPYGYLLVETPILNVKARLPINHQDDFRLAATVYDDPQLVEVVEEEEELLVTYFPKNKLPMGAAGITHAIHYVIVPRGTLEQYYEFNNDEHMANSAPEKLFKRFAWEGELRVELNSDPEF